MNYQWQEQWSVGDDLVDSDHRHLLEIINRIQSCLDRVEMGPLTSVMNDFARFLELHFAREEKIASDTCNQSQAQQMYERHLELLFKLDQLIKEGRGIWRDSSIDSIKTFIGELMAHCINEEPLVKMEVSQFAPPSLPG